jgi:uracil-DNA glycosylase
MFDVDHWGDQGCQTMALEKWNPESWPVAADWQVIVNDFLDSATGQQLGQFLTRRLDAGAVIYPPAPLRALELTPLADVKVVILGQDPYHGCGQAEGLAFSVPSSVKSPPSLKNIFKEIAREAALEGKKPHAHQDGSLMCWARQGVLLLNTCLTVEDASPASHAQQGWETFTDKIIQAILNNNRPVVFMLWGDHAQTKQSKILENSEKENGVNRYALVLTASHPSPLSATRGAHPFMGCDHFRLANVFLEKNLITAIDW